MCKLNFSYVFTISYVEFYFFFVSIKSHTTVMKTFRKKKQISFRREEFSQSMHCWSGKFSLIFLNMSQTQKKKYKVKCIIGPNEALCGRQTSQVCNYQRSFNSSSVNNFYCHAIYLNKVLGIRLERSQWAYKFFLIRIQQAILVTKITDRRLLMAKLF